MSWNEEWSAIDNQIQEVDRLCASTIAVKSVKSTDSYGVVPKIIFPACKLLLEHIKLYKSRYSSILPKEAMLSIDAASIKLKEHFHVESSVSIDIPALLFYKETFNRLRFEFNYYVNELEGSVYRKSERAFIHLQRTLAVSKEEQDRWRTAFECHETHVEALGAVHLLSHGIWAFKVDGGGQRTDLVFQEAFTSSTYDSVRVASEGLVLTEWKLVRNPKEASKKSQEALTQAKIYSSESLAETELTRYRYLVLVSLKKLSDLPHDFDYEGVRYRHINIAIEIESPSIRAAKNKIEK